MPQNLPYLGLGLLFSLTALNFASKGPSYTRPDGDWPDSPQQMRLPYSLADAQGMVEEAWICGPFPVVVDSTKPWNTEMMHRTLKADPPFDGAAFGRGGRGQEAEPKPGAKFEAPGGSHLSWRMVKAEKGRFDLAKASEGASTRRAVSLAYIKIVREKAGEEILYITRDDMALAWLNGKPVLEDRSSHGLKFGEAIPVRLEKGENVLVLKVLNGEGNFGFSARFLKSASLFSSQWPEWNSRIAAWDSSRPHQLRVHTDTFTLIPFLKNREECEVSIVLPGGRKILRKKAMRGETVAFDTRSLKEGPFEIQVQPRGDADARWLMGYQGNWQTHLRRVMDRADSLEKEGRRATGATHLPENHQETRLIYGLLRQAILDRNKMDPRLDAPDTTWKRRAPNPMNQFHPLLLEESELRIRRGKKDSPGFHRLAWTDSVDGSSQFAKAHLPSGYRPDKRWPLIVVLHGYNPSNRRYSEDYATFKRHHRHFEKQEALFLEPFGRGNSSYRGIGEADVLRAIAKAKSAFAVDPDRVYLTGYSMGGSGTWLLGSRHPELFAAIAPIYGGWDYRVDVDKKELDSLDRFERHRQEVSSTFAQAEALLTTPVFVAHGDRDDLVPVGTSRYAVSLLQRWGYDIRYHEVPGGDHGDLNVEGELFRRMLALRRQEPGQVRLRSPHLQGASAHWMKVEESPDPWNFIMAEARILDGKTMVLDTRNANRIRLSPPPRLLARRDSMQVIWNGTDLGHLPFDRGSLRVGAVSPSRGKAKRPDFEGPMEAVRQKPFAIVAGTRAKDSVMAAFCRLRAEDFRNDWKSWQNVEPRFFLDRDMQEKDIEAFSLLLIGGPEENQVTQKLARYPPLRIDSGAIEIDGERFPIRNAATGLVYPHPLNDRALVAVVAAQSAAGMYHAAKLPFSFDYSIIDGSIGTGKESRPLYEVRGFFDSEWRYRDAHAQKASASLRQEAISSGAPRHMHARIPGKTLYLDDLLESRMEGAFKALRRAGGGDRPLRLAGSLYPHGLGVPGLWRGHNSIEYDLEGAGWKRFKATLGVESFDSDTNVTEEEKRSLVVEFQVLGDGKELFRSKTFRWKEGPQKADLAIDGVRKLQLSILPRGGLSRIPVLHHWAEARLEK